jgi:hypothetical protein
MKSALKKSRRWRTIVVLAPLALLVVLAIATSSYMTASSAAYCGYSTCVTHLAPASQYGISNQLLYVANGRASNVAVIDVGTMSIVDYVPVPNEVTPDSLRNLNPDLMNWEIHGAAPSQDRSYVYAVGALSGGSYPLGHEGDPDLFRLADYRMYKINTATKVTEAEIPLQDSNDPTNPVGYCGLEYNLNNEGSNEIVAASMNASNATLLPLLGIDLDDIRGSGYSEEGGWSVVDLNNPGTTQFISTDWNGNHESSTCGISWDLSGSHGYASQMFEAMVTKVDWGTRTTVGENTPGPSSSYHQNATDKENKRLYVTNEGGTIDVFNTDLLNVPGHTENALIGRIDIRALTGTADNRIHGVELSPGHPNILYVISRNTPDASDNMALVVDVTDINAPVLKGSVNGLATSVCGVYAISGSLHTGKPALSLSKTNVYWASLDDYLNRKLSVDYAISNGGPDAANVTVVGSISTNGVTPATTLPLVVGNIPTSGSAALTLQYNVPVDVSVFLTTTYATAQGGADIYNYPGPYPGA